MTRLSVASILPNPDQPRTVFDEDELNNLAKSIKENGGQPIQPIVVEKASRDQYIIVDGERRWRAVKMNGGTKIEAVVQPASKGNDRLVRALIANVQREAMGPVDEGRVYKIMLNELGSQRAVAERVGVSINTISLRMSILQFAEPVQRMFNQKRVPFSGSLISKLSALPHEKQIRVVTMGVTRGWSLDSFERMLTKELKDQPNVKLLGGHRKKKEFKVEGHFDALALVEGYKSLASPILQTARRTCEACALYTEASVTLCKQCPLPDFLRKLKEKQS